MISVNFCVNVGLYNLISVALINSGPLFLLDCVIVNVGKVCPVDDVVLASCICFLCHIYLC